MKIILSPIASDKTTKIFVDGLNLIVDGQIIDLSIIPDGGIAIPENNDIFIGNVTRDVVTIKYFYDSSKAIPNQSMNIDDYTFDIESGNVPCPIRWR